MGSTAGLERFLAGIGRMGTDMKKLILVLILALLPGLSFAGSQEIRSVVGMAKVQGPTYATIFFDDFNRAEGGAVGGSWTSETDSAGPDLLSITDSALVWSGTATTAAGYVTKDVGANLIKYKVTKKIKFDTLTMSSTNSFNFLAVRTASSAVINLYAKASTISLNKLYVTINKEDSTLVTGLVDFAWVAGTVHDVELVVSTATTTDSNDGTVEVKIDGVSVYSMTGLDTYSKQGRVFRAGMQYTDSALTKIITIDDFEILEAD